MLTTMPDGSVRDVRALLTDIDGTLLGPRHELTDRSVRAIRRLARAGVGFGFATGRMPSGTDAIARRLAVPCARVCYSGAYVVDENGAVVLDRTIPGDVARDLLAFMGRLWPALQPCYFTGPHWCVRDPDAPAIRQEAEIVGCEPEQADLFALLDRGALPNKVFVSRSMDTGTSLRVAEALRVRYPMLDVIRSASGVMIEIIPHGVDKAAGAHALLAVRGLSCDQLMAFGDDMNDVPLLKAAGWGVAMGNAAKDVRTLANDVAPSNAEDGFARYLDGLHPQTS
ncbi:HAD family hydrolase [bacterium]|nr:HAD family hydrolase [bacterium]